MKAKPRQNPPTQRLARRTSPAATHDEIACSAKIIWEAEGCPTGRDVAHWLLAEAQLQRECQASDNPTSPQAAQRTLRRSSTPRPALL